MEAWVEAQRFSLTTGAVSWKFIGCDAHKKFSVFVAVNEKGNAGEALRLGGVRGSHSEDFIVVRIVPPLSGCPMRGSRCVPAYFWREVSDARFALISSF
jgi:hypothetical protein